MTASVAKLGGDKANVVAGFSARFNQLMDRAGIPSTNRVSIGARRFEVVHNTFKNWCEKNKIPGKHALLVQVVEALLADIPGRHDSRAVMAWLLAGDAVPDPFEEQHDAVWVVELYFAISDLAKAEGLDFDVLPRNTRNLILKRVQTELEKARDPEDQSTIELSDSTRSVIAAMIETAQSMT